MLRAPFVSDVSQPDPLLPSVDVALSYTSEAHGGTLRVTFCGDPAARGQVHVSTLPPMRTGPGGRYEQRPFFVRYVAHSVSIRLVKVGDAWVPATNEHAWYSIKQVEQNGITGNYATEAATAEIRRACGVAADAALSPLPWGWKLARVAVGLTRRDSQRSEVDKVRKILADAEAVLADTDRALAGDRAMLVACVPGEIGASLAPVLVDPLPELYWGPDGEEGTDG
jgi:hypothetical protein